MRLLTKRNKMKEPIDWSKAYTAIPAFYSKPDGHPFGSIALTEGTETILPIKPQNLHILDGKKISEWKMVLVSTTTDNVIGMIDYFVILKKLEKYIIDSNKNSILIRELSFDELNLLLKE